MSDPPSPPPAHGRRRLVRGSAVVVVGNIAAKALGLVPVVVLAHRLGISELGAFTFGVGFTTFVATVSDLGVDQVATRELARLPEERDVLVGSALLAKTVALALCAAIVLPATFLYAPHLRAAALVGLISVLGSVPTTVALAMTAELELTGPTVIAVVGTGGIAVALTAGAAAGLGAVPLLALQSVVQLLTAGWLTAYASRALGVRPRVDTARAYEMGRAGLPLALSAIAVVVYVRIDQLMLARMDTAAELARYGIAVRVVDVCNVLPIAIATVALPALSRLDDVEGDRARRLASTGYRMLSGAVMPLAALATVAGGPVLAAVFGQPYAASGAPLAVLLWAHAFAYTWMLGRQVLVAGGATRSLATLAVIGAVVNVLLNLWLIPAQGATGAAIASLVSYAMPVLVGSLFPSSAVAFRLGIKEMVRPAAAAAVLFGVLLAADRLLGPVAAIVSFVVVAPLLALSFHVVDRGELKAAALSFGRE